MKLYATLAIQCTPRPGDKPGTFLFSGNRRWAGGDGKGFALHSPVFPDLVAFYAWLKKSQWIEQPYTAEHPTGLYARDIATTDA